MNKKIFPLFLAFLLLLPGIAHAEKNYKEEYKFSMIPGPGLVLVKIGNYFADEVRDRTKGRINIKVYPGGTLLAGQQLNEFTMLNKGAIDFGYNSIINWTPQVKELNLFCLPFFFPKGKYIYDAVDDLVYGEIGQKLFEIMEAKDVVGLAWGENGFRQLFNNKREVKNVNDIKNLKVRIVGSPIFIDIYRSLGADPMAINMAEAIPALQQGTVDAVENTLNGVARDSKFWQFTKYITLWDYTIDPVVFGVSKKTWLTFTEEDRKIIKHAALKWAKYQKEDSRRGLINYVTGIKGPGNSIFIGDIYEEFKNHGMLVSDIDKASWKEFKAQTSNVYNKWKKEIGAELVTTAEKIVSKHY